MRPSSSLALLLGLASAGINACNGASWCDFVTTIDEKVASNPDLFSQKGLLEAGLTITAKYAESSGGVTGQGLKDYLKTQIKSEMDDIVGGASRNNYEDKAVVVASKGAGPSTSTAEEGPVAILILGPSAVGKSHLTHAKIDEMLQANNIAGEMDFVAIDGGILRENTVLPTWDEIKGLASRVGCMGFSDAYEKKEGKEEKGIAKDAMSKGKTALQKVYLGQKKNVIVPTTASDLAKEEKAIKGFADAGYRIIFMAVNADQGNAAAMGCSRAIGEGKKYSGSSWLKSVKASAALISKAHDADAPFGEFAKTATHFVFDNNDYPVLAERGGTLRKTKNTEGLQVPSGSTVSVSCTPDEASFVGLKAPVTDEAKKAELLKCDYSAGGQARFKAILAENKPKSLRGF